jgi:hypothetical protein
MAGSALAATDAARQAQVTAATANAVDALDQEISNQPWGSQHTLRDFLQQNHGDPALRDWLKGLAPLGGPRWLDDQTCQVRLEADGDKIADELVSIARQHPGATDAGSLDQAFADLRQRRFEATSTSAAADTVNNLSPTTPGTTWDKMNAGQRRQVLINARQSAANRVLLALSPLEISDGQSVGQALQNDPNLRTELFNYLQTAPVTSVDFQNNLQVQIELRPSHEELAQIIYAAVNHKKAADFSSEDFRKLSDFRARIALHINSVTGSASAAEEYNSAAPLPASAVVVIPQQPPAWVDDQMDVIGHGFVPGSQLKSIHAAEHDARINLRTRLQALHLDDSHTIMDAATHDPHVSDAINQALEQARPYKSDFNADGSVTTHEILDLHDFWQALAGAQ